jgi:hypothetical protein
MTNELKDYTEADLLAEMKASARKRYGKYKAIVESLRFGKTKTEVLGKTGPYGIGCWFETREEAITYAEKVIARRIEFRKKRANEHEERRLRYLENMKRAYKRKQAPTK